MFNVVTKVNYKRNNLASEHLFPAQRSFQDPGHKTPASALKL